MASYPREVAFVEGAPAGADAENVRGEWSALVAGALARHV